MGSAQRRHEEGVRRGAGPGWAPSATADRPADLPAAASGQRPPQSSAEAVLVRAAALGDRLSFRALYEMTVGSAYRLALRLLRSADAAEEVVQEAYCQAWAGLRGFQGEARFRTWLLSIVRNAALDTLRRERTRRQADAARMAARAPRAAVPEERLRRRELEQALEAALAELPEETRTAFVLAVLEGLRYAEVAEVLGTTLDGVKCRVYRAREHLRARLGAEFG
ncbi:MAG: RNA polymerase sigma factor [Planctomycetota bacterium]|nr:MAG: RNA polymerase sigma factor [Planctomycetota bacterium]